MMNLSLIVRSLSVVSRILFFAAAFTVISALPRAEPAEPPADARTTARAAMVARIDALIAAPIAAANFEPAPLASDAEFFRRIQLDLAGAIPRVAEVRAFLADTGTAKRAKLIDKLLASPAHASHLANTWRSIMLPGGMNIEQINNSVGVQNWLRQRFLENLRYDNLVSELLVASDGGQAGPALYYTSLDLAPEKLAASSARIFLGLQIECAQCHDHPFDHWKQRDFWGYAAFFARLRQPEMMQPGMRARLVDLDAGEVKLPNSEEVVPPKYPGGLAPSAGELGTRREQLAIWMASRDNPYLARAGVNRVWWHLFGRGLVEPVDDLGPQNRPTHPELLAELTDYFVDTGFDLRELYRTLAHTATYQRTSVCTLPEPPPPELYVHAPVKTLTAEQLYDSVNRVLHRRPQSMLPGAPATPLLDPLRQAFLAKIQSTGRNALEYQAGVLQALALLNGSDLADASHPEKSPLLGSLQAPFFTTEDRIHTLFLATLTREASHAELQMCESHINSAPPEQQPAAYGDILWALLNTAEFALNH